MSHAKSLFISTYIASAAVMTALGLYQLGRPSLGPNAGLPFLLAGLCSVLFFVWLFLFTPARTPRNPWGLLAGGVISLVLLDQQAPLFHEAVLAVVAVGIVSPFLYIVWYSRYAGRERNDALATGARMPDVPLRTTDGTDIRSAQFHAGKALWVFYRGNWCPICVAQIRELSEQYQTLAQRGVKVLMVSPQGARQSASLAARMKAPMQFLQDPDNQLARALDIVDEKGLPLGLQVFGFDTAVPMPTVILTENGRIIWRDVTDNYRVRPEPDMFLRILDRHAP